MGFRTKIIPAYEGQPSDGRAKLRIHLSRGGSLIATDHWQNYPVVSFVLHPDHLPESVAAARLSLLEELLDKYRPSPRTVFEESGINAHLPASLAVGTPGITVVLRYGVWHQPIRQIDLRVMGRVTGFTPL